VGRRERSAGRWAGGSGESVEEKIILRGGVGAVLLTRGLRETQLTCVVYVVDAFTHLGINSSNPWGLKASLYSSKEALGWDV